MNSLLIKIANLAVIFHMTLGCNWHHGLGVQACVSQCATAQCDHQERGDFRKCCDRNHEQSDQVNEVTPGLATAIAEPCGSGGDNHFGCENDGCSAIKLVEFKFWPAPNSPLWLSGAESPELVSGSTGASANFNPFPDFSHTASPVRIHLILGVQLL